MRAVCRAIGCGKSVSPKRADPALFCARHFDALPDELRDPKREADARVFLGRRDGYLADTPGLAKGAFKIGDLKDVEGTEYV